jgi:putative AdoMet-dependent methyltransferase
MNYQYRIQLFDKWAENYDHSVLSANKFPFDGYERVLDRITELAKPLPGMQVLDLGTGTANLAERFVKRGSSVWGIDFSNEMLVKARTKLPQAHFVHADLLGEWPKTLRRRFERIVSAYVFHEFALDIKINLLQKLTNRYLTACGYIIIGDVAFPSLETKKRVQQHFADKWDGDEYYWVADEAIHACKRNGLYVDYEQISSCGGIFVVKSKLK